MHFSLTRATTWNLAGYLYLLFAALISTPIQVRYLGVSQFAQYGLIMATLYLVSSIDLGLPQSVVRALSRSPNNLPKRQTLWATSSLLFILTGLLGGVVAILVVRSFGISHELYPLIFLLTLMTNVVSHYLLLPQAEGHFGYFNAKTFIVGTSNTLVAAYLSWIGAGVPAILLALLASYLLTLVPLTYFSLKFFPHPRAGIPSIAVAKTILAFGLKNQVGKLAGSIQSQYGKYLLASLSPLTLSAYVIAQSLVQKLVGGVSQLATAFYPSAARSGATIGTRQLYLRLQLSLFGLGLLAIGLYQLFGVPFLFWWLGEPILVAQIHSFLSVYRFYGLLLLLTPLASTILDGLGYPGMTSLFGIMALFIEIISALLLLPSYGLLALAYAGIISLSIMTPILLIFTGKILSRGGNATH